MMPQAEPLLPSPPLPQDADNYLAGTSENEFRTFGIADCEPDWTDGRYRLYIARGEADCIRYGQGKRYDFCVSRRHHNYYHDYRARYNSSYCFVYDDACLPHDKTQVTVVATRPDGSCEFTYADNTGDYDTRRLRNCLDLFLATKPGLERARALFTCQPLTPEETTDVQAARAVGAGTVAFEALTPAQQQMFVRLGIPLTDAEYAHAPDEVREAYIARAHLLTDRQAATSTEPQRRRAAQLFRLFNENEQLRTADWLQRYPLPDPALVAAHHTPRWRTSAPAPATGRGAATTAATVPPVLETDEAGTGQFMAGAAGNRRLTRLQQVVAAKASALFPVQELAENPEGATAGPVIIARQRDGYVVLSGNARLRQAQRAGDVDLPVWLATRANLAAAGAGAA